MRGRRLRVVDTSRHRSKDVPRECDIRRRAEEGRVHLVDEGQRHAIRESFLGDSILFEFVRVDLNAVARSGWGMVRKSLGWG